jgi:hypothetical protein
MVSTYPIVDVPQQSLSLLSGDAMLQDLGMTLSIEFSLNDDEGLSAPREPLSLHLIGCEHLTDEVIEVRYSPIGQRIRLCH